MDLNKHEQTDSFVIGTVDSCKRDPAEELAIEPITKLRRTSSSSEPISQRSNHSISTLRARLENERDRLADAEKAVEELKRMVKRTETELRDAIDMKKGAPAVVCGNNDILMSALFPFLEPVDLGRAGQVTRLWRDCCRDERFWKDLSLKRWPYTPIDVVKNFWAYHRSQITKRAYEEDMTYPHYETQNGAGSDEEYYVLYELPGIMEDSGNGPKPVRRCVKIDESVAMNVLHQPKFEEPPCTCEDHDPGVHQSAHLGLPLNINCEPFPAREIPQRLTQLKISILRASDQRMTLVMDPGSSRYEASSYSDDFSHPVDAVGNDHYQALGEIPNHLHRERLNQYDASVSALSFRVRASIDFQDEQEFNDAYPDIDDWESDALVRFRFSQVLLGFELHDPHMDPDTKHMTPPLEAGSLTRFFEMALVEWF